MRGDGTKVRAHTSTSPGRSAAGQDPSSAAAAQAAAAQAATSNGGSVPPENFLGVRGALPPDRGAIGFWKASKWATQNAGAEPVGPVRLEDGRHVVGIYDVNPSDNPREDVYDPMVSIGTFAVMGDSEPGRKRWIPIGDEHLDEGRVDWWAHRRTDDIEEALPWMLREMRGDPETDDDNVFPYTPAWDEMNEAAVAYHRRTGDFAFPLHVHRFGDDMYIEIAMPVENTDFPTAAGEPTGFAFLTREQAEAVKPDATMTDAYEWIKNSADIRNLWGAGLPIEGIVACFDDNHETDEPDEVFGTGYCGNDQLDAAIRDTMSAY